MRIGLLAVFLGTTASLGAHAVGAVRIGRPPPPAYVTGQEAASAAFSFDPFIPTARLETDWLALSKGAPEYPQIRIPFRPAYHSPYKPRFRRTRRLRDNPFPFSPTDYFGDPVLYSGVDSPRL